MRNTPPGLFQLLLKQTRKDCNEQLLILQPHEHNRDGVGGKLCTERNATERASERACSRLVKKSAGQRDAESWNEKRGGAGNFSKERHYKHLLSLGREKDKEEMTTWL